MHEWGITESVIKEIIKQAEENGLKKIDKVSLLLGDEDHLTVDSVKLCFQSLTGETILAGIDLDIKQGTGKGIIINAIEGLKDE